jgi:hypothetical protein
VRGVDTTLGTWYFSTDGGAAWSLLGTPSDTSARLLFADSDTYLYLDPDGSPTGTIASALTFRLWDRSGAGGSPTSEGVTHNVSSNGGTTAFSSTLGTVAVTINPPAGSARSLADVGSTIAGFAIAGGTSNTRAGESVSVVGDVDGDGLDDFLIGGPQQNFGAGISYLVYGKASMGSINLTTGILNDVATQNTGLRFQSIAAAGNGADVSGGLDFNNDGRPDFLIGFDGSSGGIAALFGSSSKAALRTALNDHGTFPGDLAFEAAPPDGFRLLGSGGERAGDEIAFLQDFNGDGLPDLALGADLADPSALGDAGAVYLVFGTTRALTGSETLSSFTNATNPALAGYGVIITGKTAGLRLGNAVGSAGDFNGDGLTDLIIGRPGGAGRAEIVFGTTSPAGLATLNVVTGLNGTNGFNISETFSGTVGTDVSSAGDVNGDGFDDLLVGAGASSGLQVPYIIYGTNDATKLARLDAGLGLSPSRDLLGLLGTQNPDLGFGILAPEGGGTSTATGLGRSVAAVGDVNGDGYADILVGAPLTNSSQGVAYLIFGRATADGFGGGANPIAVYDLGTSPSLPGPAHYNAVSGQDYIRYEGIAAGDEAGISVTGAGDLNGDGFDDFIIGAAGRNTAAGAAYVVFGGNLTGASNYVTGSGNVTTSGPNKILGGSAGADTLDAGLTGVGSTLNAGAGNDILEFYNVERALRGGLGRDTLDFEAGPISLNLSTTPIILDGIERIDMRANGGQDTVTVTARDVLALTDSIPLSAQHTSAAGATTHQLMIRGDTGGTPDIVDLVGTWSAPTLVAIAGEGANFNMYLSANSTLLIEQGITVI